MKRANGTGSVVKLSGNRRRPYAVKVSGRNSYGHVIQKIISYHERSVDAQKALEEYTKAQAAGKAPAVDKLDMTVGDVFEGWKAREYRKLKPASITSHNAAWNRRISRYADRKMRSMTLDEWQSILDEDEDEGRSQSLINNDAILIKALYSYSMERDIVGKDYSAYLDIPSVSAKHPRDALNDFQVAQLAKLAADGVPWADTALMLCYTGFRISEFLSLTRFSYHPEEGGYLQGGTKTDAGKNRIVPVHPKIRPLLNAWLAKGGDTIICDEDGHAISPEQYREYFKELMERIGAPEATPHWCRHTFATRLHSASADPLTVKWLLGHSTKADITAHYTHETINTLKVAIKLLA
ncbi:MAG: tyrosine-type recombinase/integrase [Oscillibacter sp.]|nr:tyrosine-type recombinase/integrase [Oscillibacter sp.]